MGQVRGKNGYPFNPERLDRALQNIFEGVFFSKFLDFKMNISLKGGRSFNPVQHFKWQSKQSDKVTEVLFSHCDEKFGDDTWLNDAEIDVPDARAGIFQLKMCHLGANDIWAELQECYGAKRLQLVHIYDYLRQNPLLGDHHIYFYAVKGSGEECLVRAYFNGSREGWTISDARSLSAEAYLVVAT
jgi:hypothetical protein